MSNERSPRALCSTTIGISGIWAILSTTGRLSNTIATTWLSMEVDDGGTTRDRGRGLAGGGVRGARHGGGPRALAVGARARDPRRGARRAAPRGVVVERSAGAGDACRVR